MPIARPPEPRGRLPAAPNAMRMRLLEKMEGTLLEKGIALRCQSNPLAGTARLAPPMSGIHRKLASLCLISMVALTPFAANADDAAGNAPPTSQAYTPPAPYTDRSNWQDFRASLDGYGMGNGGTAILFDLHGASPVPATGTGLQEGTNLSGNVIGPEAQRVWFSTAPARAGYALGALSFYARNSPDGLAAGIEYKINPALFLDLSFKTTPATDFSGNNARAGKRGVASAPGAGISSRLGLDYRLDQPSDPLE